MDDLESLSVGYMKLWGDNVPDGIVGASAAGNALLGFDVCLRYFNRKQSPALLKTEYEIPVKTTDGSWIVWVLGSGVAVFAAAYLRKAAEKMAENDFKDVGLKDVIRKSVDALKTLIDLIKHTKGKPDFASTGLNWQIGEGRVGVENEDGVTIYVPIEYFKWYLDLPPNMLSQIVSVVGVNRTLTVGVNRDGRYETATVAEDDKGYFITSAAANDDEFLFPELKHGDFVRLEGRLTRGNANSNSVGLEYNGHVINCIPEAGNIRRYKPALFLQCIVEGTISRLSRQSNIAEKRPTIIVSSIIPLESDDQTDLFGR